MSNISIGEGLRMLQGGVDRTGFADMADSLGNPGMDLIRERRALAAEAEAMDEYEKRQAESDEEFRSEIDKLIAGAQPKDDPTEDKSIMEKITDAIPNVNFFYGPQDSFSINEKIGDIMNLLDPTPDPDFEIGQNLKADGGRVGMFLGGSSGTVSPNPGVQPSGGGLMSLISRNPLYQSMIQQYTQPTFDFSQVASPSIPQPAVAPATPPQAYTPFVSTMPLYDPSTLGTGLPSTAGMADPFFVYDPYSPVGAFDAPPASTGPTPLTQDKIMETFKNLDKFTLAKQKAKADTAAKAKKQTRRGGGGSQEDRARNEARRAAMTERARDARNRGRGFSGRGTSDPGGQAARGA